MVPSSRATPMTAYSTSLGMLRNEQSWRKSGSTAAPRTVPGTVAAPAQHGAGDGVQLEQRAGGGRVGGAVVHDVQDAAQAGQRRTEHVGEDLVAVGGDAGVAGGVLVGADGVQVAAVAGTVQEQA